MLKFEKVAHDYGLHQPRQARAMLLQGAENNNEQAVLYCRCGLDYIRAPDDGKWEAIQAAFLTRGGELELNFSAALFRTVQETLKPAISLKTENGAPVLNMTFSAERGFRRGGVGNYNLCTKALDATASAVGTELGLMQATVRANREVAQTSKDRYADSNLSHAYDVLVGAFGDSKLTAWGMTARGRPPKKTLFQRILSR